jgi:hypothetical protein
VFHSSLYYEAAAQVKYSLSRNDGDYNRLQTSWRGIPQCKPRQTWSWVTLGHRWYSSGKVMGPLWTILHPKVVWCQVDQDMSAHGTMPGSSEHSCPRSLGPLTTPPPFSVMTYISVTGQNRATRLHDRNDLSFQLSMGHAFNMTWGRTTGPYSIYPTPSVIFHDNHIAKFVFNNLRRRWQESPTSNGLIKHG